MMTDRPYRAALGEAESLRQLRRGRGSQFDPYLLDIFVNLVENNMVVAEHMTSVGSEGEP
jgi:HD-GYP domain-containing protein (c-di-GMP phosphodiesterase class II)